MNQPDARRIFVTGGSSPIGAAVVERLRAQGHHVYAPGRVELDISRTDLIGEKAGESWDAIVHLAKTGNAKTDCAMTEALLRLDTDIFVFMSSWVVSLAEQTRFTDGYTHGKLGSEKLLCDSTITSRTIIRPSLVMGIERLMWDRQIGLLASCHGMAVWLVSLEEVVNAVVTTGLSGQSGLTTLDLWGERAEAASTSRLYGQSENLGSRIFAFVARWLLRHIAVFGFLRETASADETEKSITSAQLFEARHPDRILRPVSVEQLNGILAGRGRVRVYGRGWTREKLFQGDLEQLPRPERLVSCRGLREELDYDPESGLLTVEAGATLDELFDILDRHDRTVIGLPEFRDVTLGAAVMTDIHGSTRDSHIFADQFSSVRLFKDGRWHENATVRDAREAGADAVVSVVVLNTRPNIPLLREKLMLPVPEKASEWLELLNRGESTTLHWYSAEKQLMAWIHRTELRPDGVAEYTDGRFLRRYHHGMTRIHPDKVWAARGHRLLASWKNLLFIERRGIERMGQGKNLEFCVPPDEFGVVMERLFSDPPDAVGFRLSPRGVWVDLTVSDPERYAAWGYPLHKGKWLPADPSA